jgi:hypothetical protein
MNVLSYVVDMHDSSSSYPLKQMLNMGTTTARPRPAVVYMHLNVKQKQAPSCAPSVLLPDVRPLDEHANAAEQQTAAARSKRASV